MFNVSYGHRLKPNGPAIWGGCVTRRKHRVGSIFFSQKTVTPPLEAGQAAPWRSVAESGVQARPTERRQSFGRGGYACPDEVERRRGRTFCLPIAIGTGTNFTEHYVGRVTIPIAIGMIGAANLSPVTKLVALTGAVLSRRSEAESGVAVLPIAIGKVSEPENCQDAGFILRAGARFASRSASEGWCPDARC
jgi:hypothetical protein